MALATGSQRRNFEMKTGHLGATFGLFGDAIVCGDDKEVLTGKPAPDVFLVAAKRAGMTEVGGYEEGDAVNEEAKKVRAQGLVFEDATSGVIAGKRAGMNGEPRAPIVACIVPLTTCFGAPSRVDT